ncbi:MAG: DUF7711 family protein [Acidimicrobiia bacterium]
MRYSSAVGRLRAITADLDRLAGFDEDFLLEEAWVFGELLDGPDQPDVVSLALVVDLPAEEVTWCARPASAEALASSLRFEKYPLRWFWRPMVWPVWNHAINRAVRFWSKGAGTDMAALDALVRRRFEDLTVVAPPDAGALRGQLVIDFEAARLHLRQVVDRYDDPGWRREHKGFGVYPEDHLWWAAKGFLEVETALKGMS